MLQHREDKTETTSIAVGTAVAGGPPQDSVRAELLHTALTLDDDAQGGTGMCGLSHAEQSANLEARPSVRS